MVALKNFPEATRALVRNTSRETLRGHRFRTLSLAALDYVAQTQKIGFTAADKERADGFLALGIIVNDHFDTGKMDAVRYRELKLKLNVDSGIENLFHKYWRQIRSLERSRPSPGQFEACIKYREATNLVSLASSVSVAFRQPTEMFVDRDDWTKLNPDGPQWFKALYFSIMAFQVVDDMVGWRGDQASQRPSFFTARGLIDSPNSSHINDRYEEMGLFFERYVRQASAANDEFIAPIVLAAYGAKLACPTIFELLRRCGARRIAAFLMSPRDADNR